MHYNHIEPAVFIDRPNRFIAHIETESGPQVCHVKNTGRCRELLIPGAKIFVQRCVAPTRKTHYDLISVRKGEKLINIDSAAPNRVFAERVRAGGLFGDISLLRPETRFGSSRFDFYIEADGRRAFVEVKGVTLEENGVVRFPDAPTIRGERHLRELISCVEAGYDAYAVFIIQMKGVSHFEPNRETHPAFGEALRAAERAGVILLATDCRVTETEITAGDPVPIVTNPPQR